uniref:Matrix protein n=1 Tax=Heterorhabditis bacteriophora TaxID=37862 RepID=A0A1I7X6A9_HETBA
MIVKKIMVSFPLFAFSMARSSTTQKPSTGSLLSAEKCDKSPYSQEDDFKPAEKRAMMETLTLGNGSGSDTSRRTIQRNRVKPIQPLVMGNMDASKYRHVSEQGDLLLKDDNNMIIVTSRSLLNHIFVVLNLVNPFGGGLFKQIPRKAHETGSPQLYTVMMEVNGGYWLPIFFVFIRNAKKTTYEDVFVLVLCNSFLVRRIEPLRGQAPVILPGVKFITDFKIQAINAIKASYPAGTPTLYEMVKFCAAKLTMANMLAISFGNESLKDRYIRKSDERWYLKPQSTINPSTCLTICAPLSALCSRKRFKNGRGLRIVTFTISSNVLVAALKMLRNVQYEVTVGLVSLIDSLDSYNYFTIP